MANFVGSEPSEITRFLGFIDEDDPTNLPLGCAALSKNTRFTLTSGDTRFGYQTSMQGINKRPITGLLGLTYTPIADGESFFQLPTIFDQAGALQYENPVGSGYMHAVTSPLFTLPQMSHMIGVQAYNRAYMAFSDLKQPTSRGAVLDVKTQSLYPYGLKPFGGPFMANTQYLVGEMATPTVPNGHSYRVITAGTTTTEPAWSTTESSIVASGSVQFQEYTAVLANRLPSLAPPAIFRVPGIGAFPAGRDVYIGITLLNGVGEAILSSTAVIVNTNANDAVSVTIPTLAQMPGWISELTAPYAPVAANIYEGDVPTGNPKPGLNDFHQAAANIPLGSATNVSSPGAGAPPPSVNTARITTGMIVNPVTAPVMSRVSGSGSFAPNLDVYVRQSYTGDSGETLSSPAASILLTQTNDAFQVTIEGLDGYPQITGINLYECSVTHSDPEPDVSLFGLVGTYQPGDTATITGPSGGQAPQTTNTTGVRGNVEKNTETGGPNNTQGMRYAVIAYQNTFKTISGIIPAITSAIVDEDGWQIGIFKVATGPSNIIARIVGFTVANGTPAGAFGYLSSDITANGISMTSTVIPDNVSNHAIFNFTDQAILDEIAGGNDLTYRLQTIWPQAAVDVYYAPSVDRIFQTGVPGFYSGVWVSRAADPETFQADTGSISIGADDGERAWCVREFRGTVFALRERSGFILSPSTADPSSWSANQRWSKVGPCGPRAVDVCGEFMIFVHRSGIYRYDEAFPERVSKEIPRFWNTINWRAAETIWCYIDIETQVVYIGLPVGGSTVPNVMLTLNYEEGWNNPLLFGRYNGKEVTVEQCRKYSQDDGTFFVGARIERELQDTPIENEGPVDITEEQQQFRSSQMLLCSSGPDGTVQAVQPGVYDDNGAGIDWQYETTCPQKMMSIVQLRGVNINALGNGTIFPSFVAARKKVTDWSPGGLQEVPMTPFDLSPDQMEGISRQCKPVANERFRLRLHNGKVPGAWASVKYACIFTRNIKTGRSEGGK